MFGDLPLDAWPEPALAQSLEEPWITFAAAREMLAIGSPGEAIDLWRVITEMANLESRHYAQAWHFLRGQGVQPPATIARTMLGVVLEVGLKDGLDLLAAYPDHTARYINFVGQSVIWEHPDPSLDSFIDALLNAAKPVLQAIAPWPNARPAPPPAGHIRINLLSPAGLHFGQGPIGVIGSDPFAKPTFDAAKALLQQLVGRGSGTPAVTKDD